jgi:hypothetical protein
MSQSDTLSRTRTVDTMNTHTSVEHSEIFKLRIEQRTYMFQVDEKSVSSEYYVGHPEHRCIHITAHPIYHELILQEAKSRTTCSIDGTHERKLGTVKMILAAVGIVLERERGLQVSRVLLVDKSYVEDLSVPSETHRIPIMPLASYYMLVYGQTWYQMYMHARPHAEYSKAIQSKLNKYVSLRNATKSMSFNLFWKSCCKVSDKFSFAREQKRVVEALYDANPTWGEFFSACRKHIKYPVEFFAVNLDHILDTFKLENLTGLYWEISIEWIIQEKQALMPPGSVELQPWVQQNGGLGLGVGLKTLGADRLMRKWKNKVSFM